MLARYLGSKQNILNSILDVVGSVCEPGGHVVDAFSGSLAVSLGLKRAGYRVTANDINLFSSVLARAYLLHRDLPDANLDAIPLAHRAGARAAAGKRVLELAGHAGWTFLNDSARRNRYINFVALQAYLRTLRYDDLPANDRRSHFFDAYCEDGAHSAFTSARGSTGRRRFLIPANALRLDLILNQLRVWRREFALDDHTEALLIATVLRAVERVSNTQGTFHDFPREVWDQRALRALSLDPPAMDDYLGGATGHRAGLEQDSLEFIPTVGASHLLYLDPPYNFRQYTAYYFLANVICRYPQMLDPSSYFAQLTYVRGQNPSDDFSSTFCKPSRFIADLATLIQKSGSESVLISYFNGRNHWSQFDSGPDDTGQKLLEELLTGPDFEPGSLGVQVIPRTNYASYGGYRARRVDELLLFARRRQTVPHDSRGGAELGLRPVA